MLTNILIYDIMLDNENKLRVNLLKDRGTKLSV